ncbi:MAG: PKD domain-containing protein [Sphingobacteriales bacterium]|nr:MAG: PKD domain-containing protein [Sphingobacteriales bacterium]
MRKTLFLLTLLGLFATLGNAAPVWLGPITHTSGTAPYTGNAIPTHNVTITRTATVGLSPIPQTICNTGPYVVGGYGREDINFHFDKFATQVKVNIIDFQSNDELAFYINGTLYNVQPRDLFNNDECTPVVTHTGLTMPSGHLTSSSSTPSSVQVQIDAAPNTIQDFKVEHVFSNTASGGAVFKLHFADDTCMQRLDATSDTPCSGRILHLNGTEFPNTTFNWSFWPSSSPTPTWTATGAHVTRPNISTTQTGKYFLEAIRGACTYRDTVDVFIRSTPAKPIITYPVPMKTFCKGDTVKIKATTSGFAGVIFHWYDKNWSPANQNLDTLILEDVQPIDEGTYYEYAEGIQGCISDTLKWDLVLNPDVTAGFTVTQKLGCLGDTFTLHNASTGATDVKWFFTPAGSTILNPIGANWNDSNYVQSYDNNVPTPINYNITLAAFNGCKDTAVKGATIFHPLIDSFTTDTAKICQGKMDIKFTNLTSDPLAGTNHAFYWAFGDGDSSTQKDPKHLYTLAGIFNPTLYVVDFLGCVDSFKKQVIVDSTGIINFMASDTSVCVGKTIAFDGLYSRLGSLTTGWDFGDGNGAVDTPNVVYTYENPGTYNVKFTLFNRICPDTVKTKKIVVKPFPVIELGPDTAMCPNGAPIAIGNNLPQAPGVTYLWNQSTQDVTSSVLVRHPGTYSLTATLNGCSTTDSILVAKNCFVDIPNAFTPDGDGNNDYFLPRQFMSRGVQSFTMTIFDRWGKKVFETNSSNGRGWDGKYNGEYQPSGVYIYLIDVNFVNSTNERYQGNVTLLR